MFSKSVLVATLISAVSAVPVLPISPPSVIGVTCPKASYYDSAAHFVADPLLALEAVQAQTPCNYTRAFVGLKASNNAPGYMQYQDIEYYNPAMCAAICDSLAGCASFNIYFGESPRRAEDILYKLTSDRTRSHRRSYCQLPRSSQQLQLSWR